LVYINHFVSCSKKNLATLPATERRSTRSQAEYVSLFADKAISAENNKQQQWRQMVVKTKGGRDAVKNVYTKIILLFAVQIKAI
jgi:hypothetical protein